MLHHQHEPDMCVPLQSVADLLFPCTLHIQRPIEASLQKYATIQVSRATADHQTEQYTNKLSSWLTLRFMYWRARRVVLVLMAPSLAESSSTALPCVVSKPCRYRSKDQ